MKFNLIYIFWVLAMIGLYFIKQHITSQSLVSFFGSTESESVGVQSELDGQISRILIRPGSYVQKGDTLFILQALELNKKLKEQLLQIDQLKSVDRFDRVLLEQEERITTVQYDSKLTELKTELKELEGKQSFQDKLKESLLGAGHQQAGDLQIQIEGLRKQIEKIELEKSEKLNILGRELSKKFGLNQGLVQQHQSELDYLNEKTGLLFVRATLSGFVEDFKLQAGDFISSKSNLVTITPKKPLKVRGFIPESSELEFEPGSTVRLVSSLRPTVTDSGRIIYCNPRVVELPTRLRKNPEIKAWGREIYIDLSVENPFFIGEKIRIELNPQQSK
ncbi:MAG: HlyD family efflux transporter periplasmic adaptor subunit [Saprospiraceae bacterium]|nr:HlyD family efflux transporter periplasmic adaptor subunit [Saprospiraceae bacterium]